MIDFIDTCNHAYLMDFDGTLADAPRLWSRATRSLLNRSGYLDYDFDIIRLEMQFGFPWDTPETPHIDLINGISFWEFLNNKVSTAMVASGVSELIAHQLADGLREEVLLSHGYQLVPNAKGVLKELSSYGFSHVIATSHIPELSEIINPLGISSYFDMVYTSGIIGYEKPNPKFLCCNLQRFAS